MRPGAALEALTELPSRRIVGLMSGTSADGVDAALVEVSGHGAATTVETIAFVSQRYDDALCRRVLGAHGSDATALAKLHVELGEIFAEAAVAVCREAGIATADVHLIGSHGQTVVHRPGEGVEVGGRRGAVTLQIGDAAVIAERLGLPVIHDFRRRDAAAGGEAAPLVPWVDWLLLRPQSGTRMTLNLGGVANVTLIAPEPDDVRAFDTGPANGPIDAAARRASGGALECDRGGVLAATGTVDETLVTELLTHEFFALAPPRTLSRDTFAERFVAAIATRRAGLSGEDLVATLTEFVAAATADAVRRFGGTFPDDVIVSGGGVRNPVLMAALERHFAPATVRSSAEIGIDPDAREAIAFAVLANETLFGGAGNLPAVTGAAGPRILGVIAPA